MNDQTNDSGLTYAQWLEELDIALIGMIGLGYLDLTDTDTYSAWQDDMPPSDHASDMLHDNGLDPSLFL